MKMAQLSSENLTPTLRSIPQIEASIALHKENVVRGFLGIGQDLLDAKAQLHKHGAWMPWLEKMGFNQSTANKYMKLAQEIQPGTYMATLPYSKAMALLALPAEEREGFAQEVGAETRTAAEIKKLIRERDEALRALETANGELYDAQNERNKYRQEAEAWKQEAENRPATIQQVVETPDDYQALKMQAARHATEMQEALDAAADAEQRADAAEAELRHIKMREGSQDADRFSMAQGAANSFLMAVQLLPYDRQELGSAYNRQRYGILVKGIREWCDEMADALEGGMLNAAGEVV